MQSQTSLNGETMTNRNGQKIGHWSGKWATRFTLLASLSLLGSAANLEAAGSVSGRVTFSGSPPAVEAIEITQDTNVCGSSIERSSVEVDGSGGLRSAVVHIAGGGKASADEPPPDLVQEGCRFAPRVVVARPESEIGVLNNDGILHNVHTYSEANPVVNLAQPGFVKRLPLTFDEPERVRVTCDVHSWMEGWVVVTDARLVAVTDETGGFALEGVPAGEHEISVWHPTLGEKKASVSVADGAEATVTIEFGG